MHKAWLIEYVEILISFNGIDRRTLPQFTDTFFIMMMYRVHGATIRNRGCVGIDIDYKDRSNLLMNRV